MTYTDEQKKDVLGRIFEEIENGKSLRRILKEDIDMPTATTFFKWIDDDKDLVERYTRAMKYRADCIFEKIEQIANTPQVGVTTKIGPNGMEVTEGDMLGHRRLQIDTYKWMAGRLSPSKYGDRIIHAGDKNNPIAVEQITGMEVK